MKMKITPYALLAVVMLPSACLASEPGVIRARHKPGTRGHFRNHIEGRYALRQGTIIKLTHVFGTVIRKVTNDTVLVSERIDRFERNQLALISTADTNALPTTDFGLHALPSGFFSSKTESGDTLLLPAYRIVPTMTLDQYITIFSKTPHALFDIDIQSLKRMKTERAQHPAGP